MGQVIQVRTMRNEVLQPEIEQRFERFSVYRYRINERLDTIRDQLDECIASIRTQGDDPGVADLAFLEGLLATRRDFLAELIELDEKFLDYLLAQKQTHALRYGNGVSSQAS